TAILKNLGSICRAISLIEPQHIVGIQVNDVVGLDLAPPWSYQVQVSSDTNSSTLSLATIYLWMSTTWVATLPVISGSMDSHRLIATESLARYGANY
ncbi:hypothetical protein HKBW3S42_01638, partial [Candidatus Hakubella thermalkaliphila]